MTLLSLLGFYSKAQITFTIELQTPHAKRSFDGVFIIYLFFFLLLLKSMLEALFWQRIK